MSLHSIQNRNDVYHSLDNLQPAERRIYDYLVTRPNGATRHEIGSALSMPLSTVCGRVASLEARELVVSTAEKRETYYGKSATVVRVREREKPIQLELFSE